MAGELLDRARDAKNAGLTADGMCYGKNTDQALAELSRVAILLAQFDPMSRHQGLNYRLGTSATALAFWINLYNALVIHGAMYWRVKHSITEVRSFFKRTAYILGGRLYSLNVIEHGLLRANRGHPLRLFVPQLMPWDRRRILVIRPMDVRIHFALNCGAASCPPIRHYTAANIDNELELAAKSFTASGVTIDSNRGGILLSRLFFWYACDFGWSKRAQLKKALQYLDDSQRSAIEAAVPNGIGYADYDWHFA